MAHWERVYVWFAALCLILCDILLYWGVLWIFTDIDYTHIPDPSSKDFSAIIWFWIFFIPTALITCINWVVLFLAWKEDNLDHMIIFSFNFNYKLRMAALFSTGLFMANMLIEIAYMVLTVNFPNTNGVTQWSLVLALHFAMELHIGVFVGTLWILTVSWHSMSKYEEIPEDDFKLESPCLQRAHMHNRGKDIPAKSDSAKPYSAVQDSDNPYPTGIC